MRIFAFLFCSVVLTAATPDISGAWIAEITSPALETQYARVTLQSNGSSLTGEWGHGIKLEGSQNGGQISLKLTRNGSRAGALAGSVTDSSAISGTGQMAPARRVGNDEQVTWKLTRPAAQSALRTIDFEPAVFYGYYSASNPAALHIFPGDTVRTRTFDQSGRDAAKRTPGANLETGPFYVEGALPGDTLVVKLNKIRLNRDSARQGTRINGRALTPAWIAAAQYDPAFDGEWTLDRVKNVATLAHPTPNMKNFTVPVLPMLGCIATAPAGNQSFRAVDLGPYGGNMDYNQMTEGVTLYLPVFHPGAGLSFGDAHAAMGDAELTGSALETSVDVEFTVDLIHDYASAGPRLENAEYLMAMGVSGSVHESIQVATSELANWLKRDYKLNDSEVAVLLGAVAKYDITELVDPQLNVVAKVPKSALRRLLQP